jgi:P-type Cu2+ transporter
MMDHDAHQAHSETRDHERGAAVHPPAHQARHDGGASTAHDMSGAGGHDRHEGHSVAMFRDKFWLSLALTIPVVLLSHDIQTWLGYEVPMVPGIEFIPAVLGTIIFLYGGLVFLRGAQGELADRQPGMMNASPTAWTPSFGGRKPAPNYRLLGRWG